jgi:hypothetical protein
MREFTDAPLVAVPQNINNDVNVMALHRGKAGDPANLPLCIILNGSNKATL